MTDESQIDGVTHAEKDSNGNIVHKPDVVDTESLDNVFFASNFDGADGGAKIQNALDKADSETGENGVIIGPAGPDSPASAPESDVWKIDSGAPIDPEGYDNTHLIGYGYPMMFLGDGVEEDIIRTAIDDSGSTTENVTIRGIRFHGNRSNNTQFDPWDPDGDGSDEIKGLSGIRAINCSGWTVEDCTFQDFTRYGYCAKLTQGPMVVRDCAADNCGDDGFTVGNQFFQTQNPDSASHLFISCTGENNDDQGIEFEDGARYCTIRDSEFADNGSAGITVKSHVAASSPQDEEPCEHIHVHNTVVRGHPNADIGLAQSNLGDTKDIYIGPDCLIGATSGVAVRVGDDRTNDLVDVTLAAKIIIDGGGKATITPSGATVRDYDADMTVEVANSSNVGDYILDMSTGIFENVTLSGTIDATGADAGVSIESTDGALSDITIAEDFHVENADGQGINIRPRNSNNITDARVSGTAKNNGQGTSKGDALRVGLRLFQGNGQIENCLVTNFRAYDDQGTQTQLYGMDPRAECIVSGCDFGGNGSDRYVRDPVDLSLIEGRGHNSGDPNSTGRWNGETTRAEEHNAIIEDTDNNTLYMAVNGSFVAIDTQ